jgi:chorismate dehydratase
MKRPPALQGLRIGCVQYLNSRPLIHGLSEVELAHPSDLASRLQSGGLDAALVPVFELLRSPHKYLVVDGVGIISEGPVYSVFVAHQRPLAELAGVIADPASLTSIHLFQVLSAGMLRQLLPLVSEHGSNASPPGFGRLLIGNQAIAHRLRSERAGDGEQFWDLGSQWTGWTGLPFVYAAWVLRRDIPGAGRIGEAFRGVADEGVQAIPEIAAAEPEFGDEIARRYLTENIRFKLGEKERSGLARFREELRALKFVAQEKSALEFV